MSEFAYSEPVVIPGSHGIDIDHLPADFASHIDSEKTRLRAEQEHVARQAKELQNRLAEVNREMQALDAYETIKSGRTAPSASVSAARKRTRAPGLSNRQDSLQPVIHSLVAEHGPLSRGELLGHMGVKGDVKREMSVSNALTKMTKNQVLRREDGKYHLPA